MTVNPDKVKIHLTEVEYVGHVIDKYGISFSDEKRSKVTEFRQPTQARDMKKFLGLISQFRDHVPYFSILTAPFHGMIEKYTKGSTEPLLWNNELEIKFKELQDAVSNCCKLYFLDDELPIFLHTDASVNGIGCYLFQDKDGEKIPIQFINKGLNKTERNWNIVEKEAYAIFYSIMKLDHILRDRHFTLRTDSKILSHMNVDHKEKVKRWKIAIQHFDFNVQHIKGTDNIEADALSRLTPHPEQIDLSFNTLEQTEVIQTNSWLPKPIYETIKKVHGGPLGHGGVRRTLNLLQRSNEHWQNMRKDVTAFIRNCPCCQKMKRLKTLISTMPFTLATYQPMQRVYVDAIGPINVEDQEYKHILVFIDSFSRMVRLVPLKAVNSAEFLKAFNYWIADFGVPSELVSDNASYFLSELIKSFVDFARIEHSTIHAYSHEENGIVERANQEVMRHLTAMIADMSIKKNWPNYLPFIQRIMNTQIKTTTGVSPTELIFGSSVNHDSQFLIKPNNTSSEDTHHQHVEELMLAQEKIIKIAQDNQEEHDIHVIATRAQTNSHTTHFPINSYVLVDYEVQKETKLHTKKHGPYRVVNNIGTVYTVEHLVTKSIKDFHVKLLTEYKNDTQNTDITNIAKLDDEYADIVQVINHKFVPPTQKKRTNLQFLLTWDDDLDPKWYPWNKTLGGNELIHKYLDEHKLRQFIPQKYTHPRDHPENIARRNEKRSQA